MSAKEDLVSNGTGCELAMFHCFENANTVIKINSRIITREIHNVTILLYSAVEKQGPWRIIANLEYQVSVQVLSQKGIKGSD